MAYANALLFFGWSGDDVALIIKSLINVDITSFKLQRIGADEDNPNASEEYCNRINDELKKYNLKLCFFEGGLSSDSDCVQLALCIGKEKDLQANEYEITETEWNYDEIKVAMNKAIKFVKKYPDLPIPKHKVFLASDPK
jgi:hypothetical protein